MLRAALRHLDAWARGGSPPPTAPRAGGRRTTAFVLDDNGNARGGVRTPARRRAGRGAVRATLTRARRSICQLFGSTLAAGPAARLEELYADRDGLPGGVRPRDGRRDRAPGSCCAEDRDAVLAEARPDLVTVDPSKLSDGSALTRSGSVDDGADVAGDQVADVAAVVPVDLAAPALVQPLGGLDRGHPVVERRDTSRRSGSACGSSASGSTTAPQAATGSSREQRGELAAAATGPLDVVGDRGVRVEHRHHRDDRVDRGRRGRR